MSAPNHWMHEHQAMEAIHRKETMTAKPTPAEMRAAERICWVMDGHKKTAEGIRDVAAIIHREMETERAELVEALRECLGYIEMKHAHTGSQSVDGILHALEEVRAHTAWVETAHHLGCSKTTRRVDLIKARAVLAKYEQENNER